MDGRQEQWSWGQPEQIRCVIDFDVPGRTVTRRFVRFLGYDQLTRAKSVHMKIKTT